MLPCAGLALGPVDHSGAAVDALARRLRELPVPVIGRMEAGRVVLDLRCLEEETEFIAQLSSLKT
jgi:L-seryl-tRNA(Ser) seleniumtransferase